MSWPFGKEQQNKIKKEGKGKEKRKVEKKEIVKKRTKMNEIENKG